jgi:hypothetical protein
LTLNGLNEVIAQEIELFIITAVRTSIPTKHNIAETGPLYVLR